MENENVTKGKIALLFEKKPVRYSLALFVLASVSGAGYFIGKPIFLELKDSAAIKKIQEKGIASTYVDSIFSIFHKLEDLEKLDRTNEALTHKLAALEKEVEEERSKNIQDETKEVTKNLSDKLKGEAGSELARVTQSIEYKPPTHLLPHQLYTLALGYFRKHEFEQAAILFSYLTELKEDSSYQRSEVYLMNGIAWFKLKHYKLSSEYVKKTIKKSDEDTAIHRKAILWQALLAKAQGGMPESQRILTSMVARYPHSEEVTWINQRGPASSILSHVKTETAVHEDAHPADHKESHPAAHGDAHPAAAHEDAHPAAAHEESHPAAAHGDAHHEVKKETEKHAH